MTFFRMAALAVSMTFSVTACVDEGELPGATPDARADTLLLHVPIDSPYLAANLEPLPDDVIDFLLAGLRPALDDAQARLERMRSALEQGATGANREERIALALLRELDGKLDRHGLEALGFDLASPKVVYGMGAFPVARIGLLDANALRAAIDRVLADAGVAAPQLEFRGTGYWRVPGDPASELPGGLYLSVLDDHLAMGLFPLSAEAQLLPAFLGLEKPAGSDAANRLQKLNQARGYTAYGSGIIDLQLLADEFMHEDSLTARALAGHGSFDPATLTPVCRDEIQGIIRHTPRMTAGTTELSTAAVGYEYRLETRPGLGADLAALVSAIPAAGADSRRLLEFSFGMRFGPVRDFLREKVGLVVAAPYRCEKLQELNDGAVEALASLDRPLPPLINNFKGIRLSLDDVEISPEGLPTGARGHLALHVDKPEMFLGMAQMFLPGLAELAIAPGEPPVRLPDKLVPLPGWIVHAALGNDAIGLALGTGEEQGLTGFLNQEATADGSFMSANYDLDAYMDYAQRLSKDRAGHDEHAAAGRAAMIERADAFRKTFRDIADRSQTVLKFTADGFVAESRTTFKQQRDQ
ncbi:MAG: hypothetical protein RQ826_06070 [Xanthomonadales bacterium]|nr:hypothetical protein [Xanthomonadales bacterium]